jgi:hypothetical protein
MMEYGGVKEQKELWREREREDVDFMQLLLPMK